MGDRIRDFMQRIASEAAYSGQNQLRDDMEEVVRRLDDLATARRECERLSALAYIGDLRFPDLTYKSRLDECAHDLRQAESERDTARRELGEVRADRDRWVEMARASSCEAADMRTLVREFVESMEAFHCATPMPPSAFGEALRRNGAAYLALSAALKEDKGNG